MTKNEAKELLLELNQSRTRLKGLGFPGMIARLEREAGILHSLAEEFEIPLIAVMAYRADLQLKSTQYRQKQKQREERMEQDVNQFMEM